MAHAGTTNFDLTDVPGRWFDAGVDIARTRSLSIAAHGEVIKFRQEGSIMGTLVWTVPDPPSPAPLERPEDMRPSRPCLRSAVFVPGAAPEPDAPRGAGRLWTGFV